MYETKIIISYTLICLTYTLCRLHYLIAVKKDSELNDMLEELISYAGSKDIVKVFILLEVLFCPIIAPLSVMKHTFSFLFKKKQ